jgi:transposase
VRAVAEVTGYCANWIRIVARRYNQHGPAVLAEQRQHNTGAPSLLTGEHQQQLQRVASRKLQLMAACGLAQRSESRRGGRTGRTIHPQRGWEYLKRLGFSLQVPRPRHHKADPREPELFKRALPEQVRQIQHAQVEVWAMDEHRVGLKPVIRRVWARKRHRPLIRVQQRYEWLSVYGFLHPETGASQWVLLQIA